MNKEIDINTIIKIGGIIIILIIIIIVFKQLKNGLSSMFDVGGIFETDNAVSEKKLSKLDNKLIKKATITDVGAKKIAQNLKNRLDFYVNDADLLYIYSLFTNEKMSLSNLAKIVKYYGIVDGKDLYTKINSIYGLFSNPKHLNGIKNKLAQVYNL